MRHLRPLCRPGERRAALRRRPPVARVWLVTHREHNRLMHALHGNGTPTPALELGALLGEVMDEFHGLVDDESASRPVRDLCLSVRMRAL